MLATAVVNTKTYVGIQKLCAEFLVCQDTTCRMITNWFRRATQKAQAVEIRKGGAGGRSGIGVVPWVTAVVGELIDDDEAIVCAGVLVFSKLLGTTVVPQKTV